jgi:mono/diheme cytochrome c family protein
MNYPFWDVGIGYGVLMAAIAVVHVFVSHFAIGGGLYLVVAERSARRAGDPRRLAYLESLSKFFALITLVFGALTGVGIWFVIGLLNPAATEVLIHYFVWGWAIEWTFFAVEICSALVYYYGWTRMSPQDHQIAGWIYFAAAWLSLVVINGIICFMLTPGKWLETGSFWDGFFNPTFWPSLVFRTGICLLLAGVYAMIVASRMQPADFKASLVRYNARWSLVGVAVMIPSFRWYWNAIPADVTAAAFEMMPTPIFSLHAGFWLLGGLTALVILFGLVLPRRMHVAVAAVGMALGLAFFGAFEWMRESIRKPYVIAGYMYGNGVEVAKQDAYKEGGYLPAIRFHTGDAGADLFRHACRSCHTLDGYKPLRPAFDGTDPRFISGIARGADVVKGNMPPFLGTAGESALIGETIWKRVDRRPLEEIYGLSGTALGEKVFQIRCGLCHEFGGYNDNRESLVGLSEEDYDDILDNGSDYADEMPDFTGDAVERAALIAYLQSLVEGGGQQ